MSWTCMCGTSSDFGHQYGCTGTLAHGDAVEPYGREYRAGAAVAFGLMGMAAAIAENDRVRACPHCGIGPSERCYCDCAMCGPECHYWICKTCFDAGRRFATRGA